jgi:hypothetical protein
MDLNLFVGVFAITVDDVFAGEFVVRFEWLVRPTSVRIDGERHLLAVCQEE